jgi:DNA polymerase bacteriophage-type
MPILYRDIETRSTLDLKEVGVWRYAAEPSTGVWCVSFAIDDGPTQLWMPGQPIPEAFVEAARNPDWLVVAHNDAFERAIEGQILAPRFGWPLVPIERHRCTMAMGLACALPGKLEKIAEALDLPQGKDTAGAQLMRQMARPRKPRPDEDPNGGPYWHDAPEKIQRLGEYCKRDVDVERELYRRLPPLTDAEQTLWVLDAIINARGFYTDGPLLKAASCIAHAAGQAIQDELAQITAGALISTDQVARILTWLAEHGCEVKDLQKSTLRQALRRKNLDPIVHRVIELRLEAAHAAANKIDGTDSYRGADGRVRGTLRFHGAGTGRWTGHGPQPQNFKRDGEDLDAKCEVVATGDLAHVARIYPPLEAVGDIARAMICAAPGHRLLIGDFSGVESRVTAWISGQVSKLEQWTNFDATGDPKTEPYYLLGRACGLLEEIARDKGKTADLAFGYMGGIGAWDRLAPEEDTSSEDDKRRYQQTWRRLHPQTVAFWRNIDSAAIKAVRQPCRTFTVRRLSVDYDGHMFLRIILPSGRALRYPFPRLEPGKYGDPMVVFKDNAGGKWTDCRFGQGAYGGLWTENIVQAISRDLLAAAMQRLEAAGYPNVLHVHDEVVAEVPIGVGSLEKFKQLLTAVPDWAEGLPIAAKVRNGERFAKSSPPKPARASPGTVPVDEPRPVAERDEGDDAAHDDEDLGTEDDVDADDDLNIDDDRIDSIGQATHHVGQEPEAINLVALAKAARALIASSPRTEKQDEDEEDQEDEDKDEGKKGPSPRSGNGHDHGYYPHGERDSGRQIAFYIYRHADGQPYLGVKRTSTKQFPQYHWTGTTWAKDAPKGARIPYRLPELVKAPLDTWVLICAGEKDADSAAGLGFVATTNPEGERKGAWVPELNAWFAGRKRVAIMEDNDATGRAHVIEVANALRGIVPDIRIVTFHELPEHNDLTDWKERGHGRDDLLAKIEATKPYYRKPPIAPIRDWDGKPAPEIAYGVQDRFPLKVVSLFSGEGGGGKSTSTQQLAVAHVLEREWLGCIPRKGPAIYVECEDPEDVLHWRQKAIAEHYGVTQATIAEAGFHMLPLADAEESAILATAPDKSGIIHPTPLYDQLYEMAGDIKPVMIGIASAAIVFAGNENVRPEVQQFMWLLRRLARVSGGYVLLVAQPSLTGIGDASVSHAGLSGTTQWHNGSRGRAVLRAVKPEGSDADTGLREIKFYKNQYGPLSASCFVRYTNGLFLPVAGMSMDAAERAAKAEEIFVALLKKFTAQHQTVCHVTGRSYAPARFAEHPEAQGITKREFAQAMQRLLDAKVIEIRTWGRPSRTTRYLALAGES